MPGSYQRLCTSCERPLTRPDRQPKYLRIGADLAARIAAGEWAAGSMLPPQRDLATGYQVTVMTLRQALALLEADGLVETRHGTGTIVAAPRYQYDLGHLRSFADDLAIQGATVQTQLLSRGEHNGRWRFTRLRLIDGRPAVLQSSLVPLVLGKRIRRPSLESKGLYTILAGLGVHISHATETVIPAVLDAEQAKLLQRPEGQPALLSRRVSFTSDGEPVIEDVAVLPGDAFCLRTERKRDALGVSYLLSSEQT